MAKGQRTSAEERRLDTQQIAVVDGYGPLLAATLNLTTILILAESLEVHSPPVYKHPKKGSKQRR